VNTRARDFMLANHALSGGPKVAAAMGELIAENARLRAVVDAADDFWPLIESIYDAALATWEYDDQRMKYVTVQISKVDLPTLLAAYASPIGEDT
jgi:hypothetical protein